MRTFRAPPGERIRGASLAGVTLFTWGDSLLAWNLRSGTARVVVPRRSVPFGRAGCVFGDGFVLTQGDRLVWLSGGRSREIDSGIDTPDILPVELFGRRGVVLIQKYMQVRFYELPSGESRDLYSIYTPSRQAGLILHDLDGDGRPDLFCGNYWMRAPERFELAWRLFAINLWSEEEHSATVRLALAGGALVACQAEMAKARLAVFDKPADPTGLWPERRLASDLSYPRALAVSGGEIFVAEDSRLLVYPPGREIAATSGLHALFEWEGGLAGVGRESVTVWDRADMRRRPSASPRAPERTGP